MAEAFERLKLDVQRDVDIRNSFLESSGADWRFKVLEDDGGFLVAILGSGIVPRIVKFTLTDIGIEVSDVRDSRMFLAGLTLNDEGERRFVIDGEERESWQLRKRALEWLLFRSPYERASAV